MTTHANNTCGFLPLHLYEGAELDRAKSICAAISTFALDQMGLAKADPSPLRELSLQDMIDAVRTVECWNERPRMLDVSYSMSVVPDDRLTAAVYTLIHYHNPRSIGDEDDDEVPVRFTERRWGDEIVHFMLIGSRDRDETSADDDDEEHDAA